MGGVELEDHLSCPVVGREDDPLADLVNTLHDALVVVVVVEEEEVGHRSLVAEEVIERDQTQALAAHEDDDPLVVEVVVPRAVLLEGEVEGHDALEVHEDGVPSAVEEEAVLDDDLAAAASPQAEEETLEEAHDVYAHLSYDSSHDVSNHRHAP